MFSHIKIGDKIVVKIEFSFDEIMWIISEIIYLIFGVSLTKSKIPSLNKKFFISLISLNLRQMFDCFSRAIKNLAG